MKFTRARAQYQQGSLDREERKKGPDVWVFRWRAETPKGRVKRKIVVDTVEKYKTKAAAQKAVETLRMTINSETWMPSTLEELVNHYCEKELPNNKTPYTQDVYQGYLKTRILPTWGAYALHGVRTVKVEEWLASLSLSNGSKAKIRNIMHTIFEHGIRYEWIAFNPITNVRQSAKREREPEFPTVEEINALLAETVRPVPHNEFCRCDNGAATVGVIRA